MPVGIDDVAPVAGSSGGGGASAGAPAQEPSGGEPPCVPTACRGQLYACGDCIDNDADGGIDAQDPECLGPCDDDEQGLSTGLASPSAACRQDCYFDGDAGPGNDRCEWSHQCDVLSVAPNYPPTGEARCAYDPAPMGLDCAAAAQVQPAACLEVCLPLVPNGCDCFGCCELPGGSGNFRYLGNAKGGCELDSPEACLPCTPVKSCFNDCGKCETCVGKQPDAACRPADACAEGAASCDAQQPCSVGQYCVTGCCVRAPVR